jgi:hypothetical protein
MLKNKTVSAALSLAALSGAGAAPALAMKPSTPRPPTPRSAPRLAVGFRSHPHLNAAVTEGLARRGVQALAASALVPGRVYPLLVEGQLENIWEADGQVSCAVRYSIGPGSAGGPLDSYTMATSIPLPARAAGDRSAIVEMAEESCVKALGVQIAASVAGAAAPADP